MSNAPEQSETKADIMHNVHYLLDDSGNVFYVGKGRGTTLPPHYLNYAIHKPEKNADRARIIRKMLLNESMFQFKIIFQSKKESDCYDHQQEEIERICKDDPNNLLTNMTVGGKGVKGIRKDTPQNIQQWKTKLLQAMDKEEANEIKLVADAKPKGTKPVKGKLKSTAAATAGSDAQTVGDAEVVYPGGINGDVWTVYTHRHNPDNLLDDDVPFYVGLEKKSRIELGDSGDETKLALKAAKLSQGGVPARSTVMKQAVKGVESMTGLYIMDWDFEEFTDYELAKQKQAYLMKEYGLAFDEKETD